MEGEEAFISSPSILKTDKCSPEALYINYRLVVLKTEFSIGIYCYWCMTDGVWVIFLFHVIREAKSRSKAVRNVVCYATRR